MEQMEKKPYLRAKLALSLLGGLMVSLPAAALPLTTPLEISVPVPNVATSHIAAPNEVLVKFSNRLTAQSVQPTLRTMASEIKSLDQTGFTLVKLNPGGESVSAAMANLRALPGVVSVQPNYIYHATALTNDPKIGQQWALQNTGQLVPHGNYSSNNPGTPGDDIDVADAWQYQSDCSSTTVAVIDTGINYTQQDLVNEMWQGGGAYPYHGYDFVDNDNNPYPTTGDETHGTHVAGIIGAEGNNGIDGSGVCQKASIMAVRSLDASGGTTATVTQGIYFAVDHGAKIINMSLGGSGQSDQAFSDAISYAQSKGVLVVVAAGNGDANGNGVDNDQTPTYPCDFTQDNLICVAALDQSFQLASFSNYGAKSVDVGAPGTNILSTIAGTPLTTNFSGWSAALGSNTDWGYGTNATGIPVLVNPVNYGRSTYVPGTNDRTWGNFTFGPTIQHIALSYYLQGSMASGDYLNSGVIVGRDADPFNSNGTVLQHSTGTLSSPASAFPVDQCLNRTCSIGFQLLSQPTSPGDTGPLIAFFNLNTIEANTQAMGIENGTSMATPVVSGIAALLMASKPDATYAQVIAAIENSGTPEPSLTGVTTTGKAVNAMRALANLHIGITGLTDQAGTVGQTLPISFQIDGLGTLNVAATSSNADVMPNSQISGEGSCTQAGTCTLQLTPTKGGTTTVQITVNDAYGQQSTGRFLLSVTQPTSSSSGGGGGMNWIFLMLLATILGAVQWRNRRKQP